MIGLVKINNYFFDISPDSKFEIKEIGESVRTYNGTNRNNIRGQYYVFDLEIEQLSPERHSQLLYLFNLNRGDNKKHLVFNWLQDDQWLSDEDIVVDIPKEGIKITRNKGKETYNWEVTLEEVRVH